MYKKLIAAFALILNVTLLTAQVAWLSPANPSPHDTVTITFNSNEGNKGLADWDGLIYLHSGVITEKSIDGSDWKHATGNWGKKDENVKMTPLGDGLFQFTFVIHDFYHLNEDEVVQQLAFVFRNEDGSKVGKTENNQDILIPVNGYMPPDNNSHHYLVKDRKYVSLHQEGNNLHIVTDHGQVEIIPYTHTIMEVKHHVAAPPEKDSSVAVILAPTSIATSLQQDEKTLVFSTDSLRVIIQKSPFKLAFEYQGDTVLKESNGFFQRSDNNGLQFGIDKNEKLYGLGERAVDFSLVGHRYNLYNQPKYGYEFPTLNLNYSVPLVLSSKKYLLFFDNPQKGYADVGESQPGILEWGAIGGTMKYFVVAGFNHYNIMQQWGLLTGNQPLPPRWVLGNLQSRMAYRSQHETDSIVKLMQDKNFPIDAIILDFYWFGDSILGTLGRLKWYEPNWPRPAQMISNFKNKGVKTILITEPYILDSLKNFKIADELGILATDSLGKTYVNKEFYFGHGALIDIFKPDAREWFWKQYQKQIEIGVAGWWGDLGEPESHPSDQFHINGSADEVHNIYGHYWHKMLFENYREHYPEKRLFNLNRAGYAGSQRYSIYPWTGDVSRSWGGLQAQIPTMLHMSISGLPFIHSDAGGFAMGIKDDELYTRWLQMSSLSPILRPHGSGIPSEPVYFSEQTQNIVRNFMQLRYALLPYLYTAAAQAHLRGYPITRPLFFDYPGDSITYGLAFQYLLGSNIMVAPVVHQGVKTVNVYLPGNRWYSFWNDSILDGGQWHIFPTHIETIPVFVKEGSFIPMVKPVNSTDDYSSRELTLRYYPAKVGDSSFYNMYEDDGETFGSIGRGEFELLRFSGIKNQDGKLNIRMVRDGWEYNGRPLIRQIKLEIAAPSADGKYFISLNGKKIKKKKATSTTGYSIDEHNRLVITFDWAGTLAEINITKK